MNEKHAIAHALTRSRIYKSQIVANSRLCLLPRVRFLFVYKGVRLEFHFLKLNPRLRSRP